MMLDEDIDDPSPSVPRWKKSMLDKKLLQVGAYMFLWVIGLWAMTHLLQEYASALKPLVLAMLSVSILEWVVQSIEFLQWRFWVFIFLLIHKTWLLMSLVYISFENCCCPDEVTKDCPDIYRQKQEVLFDSLKDWHRLRLPWDPVFAGRNFFFRCVAVVLTLSIVATAFLGMSSLLVASVEGFASGNRLEAYKDQFVSLTSSVDAALLSLPDHLSLLPNATKDQVRATVLDFEGALHMNTTFLAENQAYIAGQLKEAVGSSSTLLVEVGLYILYTTMWLFIPLQINPDVTKEKYAGKVFGVCNVWRKGKRLVVSTEDGETTEPSRLKYKMSFARQFYKETSDPRQDLQERMYQIMQVYFSLKLLVNGLFAASVWFMLWMLGVDLSGFLGIACLILSFIPELGTIVSIALPVPIILLMPLPENSVHSRAGLFGRFAVGIVILKLLISNVLESYVMGQNSTLSGAVRNHDIERIKETHPVIILFVVVLAGQIWGPLGMLISVPLLSVFRLMLNVWYIGSANEEKNQGLDLADVAVV